MKQKCPYCEKEFMDILSHISIRHDIASMEEVAVQVQLMEEEENKREEFSKYVKELNDKLLNGQISGETFRNEVKRWYDEKRWLNKND